MSPSSAQVARIAVVGTGSIGTRHLDVLAGMEAVEPIAVPLRAERIAQLEDSGYLTATNLDDAIRKGAKLCILATDTGRHTKDGLDALERGLDLLVEKPMAANAVDAFTLHSRARETGHLIFVGCVLRFSKSLEIFREQLSRVGSIHSVRIECQSYLPDWRPARPYQEAYSARPDEGGVLLDLIHEIDYAGWLFGWPESVQGKLRNLGKLGIASEELAELVWDTPAGCVVSINLDYLSKPAHRSMTAYGELGTIKWDAIPQTVSLMIEDAPVEEFQSDQPRNDMVAAQSLAFVKAICANGDPASGADRDPRLASAQDGVKALAVCDALRRSSGNNREERVEYLLSVSA